MYLYLARHGESCSDIGELTGGDDAVLTQKGWEQAKYLARRIADEGPQHLYLGPQPRALQTAEAIRDESPLSPFSHPLFCEHWDTGYAGWPRWRLQESFPWAEIPEVVTDGHWWPAQPETRDELFVRAHRAVQFLKERHTGLQDKVLLIGHATFSSALISTLFGLPPCTYSRFQLNHAALTTIELWNEGSKLLTLNDRSHLPPEVQ